MKKQTEKEIELSGDELRFLKVLIMFNINLQRSDASDELCFLKILRMFNINLQRSDARLVYNLAISVKEKGADLDLRTIYNIYLGKNDGQKNEKTMTNVTKVKICQKCGNEFEPVSNRQMYCSEKCGMKHKYEKKGNTITDEQKKRSQSKPYSKYMD